MFGLEGAGDGGDEVLSPGLFYEGGDAGSIQEVEKTTAILCYCIDKDPIRPCALGHYWKVIR